MTRISSSVGLITGIPIEDTVKKLMDVASQPRKILSSRNDDLKKQQTAIDALGSRLLSFQFAVNKLKASSAFNTRSVTSSNTDALDVALPASGTASIGTYQARPVAAASAQQLLSQRFESADDALPGGVLSFRTGGFVDQGIALSELNGGAGVQRGKIKVTDRSGATTTIDLSYVRTIDDVLQAINNNGNVAVTASTNGDTIVLTDSSGGSGNLRVQEVGAGTTAAGLGLSTINIAANSATGGDILRLHSGTKLASLNDGNGVQVTKSGVSDLEVTLRDGTQLSIDLHDVTTLGDVVTQINAASPTKLSAAIAADGRRLTLTDLSGGAGTFIVSNGVASTAADDLGLTRDASGATLNGGRLIAGLRDTLLSSLNGGAGVGTLGSINITDRNGGTGPPINLASAETLGDVINLINASPVGVTASINAARNGVSIADDTGGSGSLVVANGDAQNSATTLGIAVNAAVGSINSGTLKRQSLSTATLLSSLNGGKGVTLGDLQVTDSNGISKFADLNTFGQEPTTVGDVIDAINALTNGVEARINDAGDGILIVDTAGGAKTLGITDSSGNIAKSLNLTRGSTTVSIAGSPTQVIEGTATSSIDLSDLDGASSSVAFSTLNDGRGVAAGDFTIKDSQGRTIAIDLNGADAGVTTVGALIDLINSKAAAAQNGFGVTARINDNGTGIYLEDTAGGSGKLTVTDLNSTTAADLKIAGEGLTIGNSQVINGLGAFASTSSAASGLSALAARINDLKAGVTASTVFDGLGYRLSLTVDNAGSANQLLVDAGLTGFEFEETSKAQDALLLYGNLSNPGAGVLLSSPDGKFAGAIGGADVVVKAASDTPVTVSIQQSSSELIDTVKDIVDSYNSMRSGLDQLTGFDADAETTGLLFGTNEALQVDSRLSQALTSRYFSLGNLQSLEQVGLSVDKDGTLSFDDTKFQAAFDKDPEGVEKFFTDPDKGVAVKIADVVDRLAGTKGMLTNRSASLKDAIKSNQDRLDKFDESLSRQQDRLFAQFYQLETVIANLQNNLSTIQNLQVLPALK